MNALHNTGTMNTSPEYEDDNVLQLPSASTTRENIAHDLEIQSRIRKATQESIHMKISLLAYEIWQKEYNTQTGSPLQNWLDAEKAISAESRYPAMSL